MTLTLEGLRCRCEDVGDCWIWQQAQTSNGYPRLGIKGMPQYAHQAAWVLSGRKLVKGLFVRRKCNEKLCCNPAHLRLSTRSQQNKEAPAAGAFASPQRIARIAASAQRLRGKLTLELAREIRASEESSTVWARRLDISKSVICRVRRNETWIDAVPNASVFHQRA